MRGLSQFQDSTYGDNRLQIHYRQDVEPVLQVAAEERKYGLTDGGIKDGLWLYARIPAVVILKLKYEYGVDVFKKDHLKKAFEIINRDFPYCKTTEKHHDLRGKGYD